MALPSHIRSHVEIDLPVVCLSRACPAAVLMGRRGGAHPAYTAWGGASWEGLLRSSGLPLEPGSLIRGKTPVAALLLINVPGEEVSVVWSSTSSLL